MSILLCPIGLGGCLHMANFRLQSLDGVAFLLQIGIQSISLFNQLLSLEGAAHFVVKTKRRTFFSHLRKRISSCLTCSVKRCRKCSSSILTRCSKAARILKETHVSLCQQRGAHQSMYFCCISGSSDSLRPPPSRLHR